MLGRIILLLATLAIFHAAFSTYEHYSHLKALGKPDASLPLDIILESLIALSLGILGASLQCSSVKRGDLVE
ncbi:hypothetical protein BT96DRAFT_1024923 [Gymnopus androsaceus JB14]|uniref:Membrane magnesium transporter n=1 Tax=Gymnopus androsaceus JB14 TaxID=1447944 RepID=A0A6A4GVH1_9AGAR|nr:hypothetical protein BT96DRAFT_1024923 [Gymnopus androsaceus JB14]